MGDAGAVRTLVLSVDVGAGHRRAGEAVAEALRALRPGSTHVLVETLEHLGPGAGELAKKLYFGALEQAPDLWGMLYERRGLLEALRPLGEFVDDLRASGFATVVRRERPDAILAMHPFACGLAGALARSDEPPCPVLAVLTDFDAHPAWVARGIHRYLTPTEAVREGLERQGLPTGTATCTGLPLRLAFERVRDDHGARQRLGLDPARLTILLLGGGLGLGPLPEVAEDLACLDGPVQLVVIAGKNQELLGAAQALARRSSLPVHAIGFVENVWDYLRAADLAVGKPGGVTCAELLACGVPLVALAPIPGQEQANADALVRAGAAVAAPDAAAAGAAVRELLAHPGRLQELAQSALRLGRPSAARAAAREVLAAIEAWPEQRYREGAGHDADPFRSTEAFADFDRVARRAAKGPEPAPGDEPPTRRQREFSDRMRRAAEDDELARKIDDLELDDELAELKRSLDEPSETKPKRPR